MYALKTLYIVSHKAKISSSKKNIVVTDPESGKTRVPIETIGSLILVGNAQVSTQAAALCSERGIRIASMRRNGRVRFVIGGPVQGNIHLRLRQYEVAADPLRALDLARRFVAAKIQNSRRSLQTWSWDASGIEATSIRRHCDGVERALQAVGQAGTGDQLRGIEGDAARRYFAGMSVHLSGGPLQFSKRSRRPPRDEVNAMMGFCYGLLEAELVGAVDAIGLDPQLGFLHAPRSGRQSLALDLLEEMRAPVADRFVVRMVTRRQIGVRHFEHTPGGAVYLTDEGRRAVLGAWSESDSDEIKHLALDRKIPRSMLPTVQATLLARHIRGDLPAYLPYVAS